VMSEISLVVVPITSSGSGPSSSPSFRPYLDLGLRACLPRLSHRNGHNPPLGVREHPNGCLRNSLRRGPGDCHGLWGDGQTSDAATR
jgi:hypothetical protein